MKTSMDIVASSRSAQSAPPPPPQNLLLKQQVSAPRHLAALLLMVAVGVFASPAVHAQTGQSVTQNSPLKPSAIADGGSFRLLFVTTQTTAATSSDIATYNAFVQASAAGGDSAIQPFSSEFRALISTEAVDARDNTATHPVTNSGTDAPIYWLGGVKAADDYTDFYDGEWDSVVGRDQNGDTTTPGSLWTGSESNGTVAIDLIDSTLRNGAGSNIGGFITATGRLMRNEELTTGEPAGAAIPLPLYALSPIFTVVPVDVTGGGTAADSGGGIGANNVGGSNNNDMRLILPDVHTVSAVAVTAYDPSADTAPPAPDGVTFSGVAMEIVTTGDLGTGTTATVCLSTAGVPGGSAAVYHLPDANPTDAPRVWEETDPPVRTIPGFVCGSTDTFSPFAVGYNQIASRLSAISQTILPEVARAITDTTVNAITQRLEQAGADSHQPGAFTLAGQSTLADILTTGGQSLAAGTLNLHDVLGRSAFVLPLTTGGDLAKNLTLWGGGDYREFGGSGGAVDWDGALFSARLGVDARVSDTLLAGAALSWTDGDFEYGELADEPTSGGGDYTLEMTSIAPYVGWSVLPGGRLNLWATAGYGWGEVAITDTVAQNAETIEDTQTSEATLKLAGGGVSARVLESNLGHVRLKGEVMQTSMELEGRDFIEALTVEARRARFSVAAGRTYTSADGARLTPTVEVGLRHDAGDGRTGTGAEVGGELSYTDPYNWLTLDTQGRVLLGHNGGYDDWGIGAIFTLKPTPGGQGLALRLTPTYGQTVTNTAQLWDQNAAALTGTDAAALGQRINAEVGYGLAMADGQSLLTPYGNMTWGQRARAYRLGSRLTLASGLNLSLESRRGETPGAATDHGVLLNVVWGW